MTLNRIQLGKIWCKDCCYLCGAGKSVASILWEMKLVNLKAGLQRVWVHPPCENVSLLLDCALTLTAKTADSVTLVWLCISLQHEICSRITMSGQHTVWDLLYCWKHWVSFMSINYQTPTINGHFSHLVLCHMLGFLTACAQQEPGYFPHN